MEYGHRMWGRAIGAVFYVSAAAFWAKGFLNKALKKRVAVAGVLLACQGLLGNFFRKNNLRFTLFQHKELMNV